MPLPELSDVFASLAVDEAEQKRLTDARPIILVRPIAPGEKTEICAYCHHLKRYHVLSALPDGCYSLKCKYETCKQRCKGYKQREQLAKET